MILSLLIGLVSILVSVLGLKCTRLGRTSEQVKGQLVLSGGVLFLLSGMKSRTFPEWPVSPCFYGLTNPKLLM